MAADLDNVRRLVKAAWTGMEIELMSQNASAEDVASAGINVISQIVDYVDTHSPEERREYNRAAIATTLIILARKLSPVMKVI
jgi:hypothetical protein